MSHANGAVKFIDGTIMYFEYNGTVDTCIPKLYATYEEMIENWRTGVSDEVACNNYDCSHEIENIEIFTDYAGGRSWNGTACRKCMLIISGRNPSRTDAGVPEWGKNVFLKEEKPMEIIRKSPDKYTLVRAGKNKHWLAKILNEYTDEKKAADAIAELVMGDVTEEELLNEYSPSYANGVEAGKLGNRINVLEAALEGIRDSLIQALGDGDSLEKAAREVAKRINELVGRNDNK